MKRRFAASLLPVFFVIALFALAASCGKSGGGGSSPEATLDVTTTPASGSTQTPAVGPFTLNVKVNSTMPSKGVTIAIKAAPDGSSTTYFTSSSSTSSASSNFTITNTPVGQVCLVTITVTSNSTASNTWSGSYRYSAK